MSHFSATGERAAAPPGRYSLRAAGVVLGAGVVFALALSLVGTSFESPVTPSPTRSAPVEEFMRLNTTALDALVSGVVFGPGPATSPFLEWNTTALTGAVSAAGVAVDPFLEWNTTALPGSVARFGSAEGSFLEWNTTALDYPPAR